MLLTLIKALNTNKLDIVVGNLSMSPLDIDVLLYEGQEKGEIEVDLKKGKIKALKEPEAIYRDEKLCSQILKIIRYYDQQEANITLSRLELVALDPNGTHGYAYHDFVCTMYAIEQDGVVNHYEITVPKMGSRPFHKFKFYTLLDHQEYGSKAVNAFIKQFDEKKKKK